jgi:hypothetical protein
MAEKSELLLPPLVCDWKHRPTFSPWQMQNNSDRILARGKYEGIRRPRRWLASKFSPQHLTLKMKTMSFKPMKRHEAQSGWLRFVRLAAIQRPLSPSKNVPLTDGDAKWRITNLNQVARAIAKWAPSWAYSPPIFGSF